MTERRQHALFRQYPLDGTAVIGGQSVPTPYHVYDGAMLFIGGTADADAARHLLSGEGVRPILDERGQALAALWVCDFTEASLGPHHELQVSLFASFKPGPAVASHPFAIYRLLALNPDAVMVCHGLWNNTQLVVDYNRDHLGLDARLSRSTIAHDPAQERLRFSVEDAESGAQVAAGELSEPTRQEGRDLWSMMGHVGGRGLIRSARSPFLHVAVVNTAAPLFGDNRIAHTYTRLDRQIIRRFAPERDQLSLTHPVYAALNFTPLFVQHGNGVHFVYLRPVSAVS